MGLENIFIDTIGYRDLKLYIYYKNYYEEDAYFNKVIYFENIKSFTCDHEELAYNDELYPYLDDLGVECFTKVFYRNKKRNKIYMFDLWTTIIIEFNEQKEWNYREQKK